MSESDLGRMPPHSEEAEKSVISAMLISPEAVDQASQIIRSHEAFFELSHRLIFEAMLSLAQKSLPCDYIHVEEELGRMSAVSKGGRNLVEEAGGGDYLLQLSLYADSAANVEHHARIVLDKARLREVIRAAGGVVSEAYRPGADPDDLLNQAEADFFALSQGAERRDFVAMGQLMADTMERLEQMEEGRTLLGVDTGFDTLNQLTSGWQGTDMIILAARPSMGKTALALNFVLNAARSGTGVVMFSLEMSAEQLAYRMISTLSGVEGQRIRTKRLRREEYKQLSNAVYKLSSYPILIDETPGIGVAELRSKARRAVHSHKAGLVIVDYLQLMNLPPRAESHQLGIATISKSLKALAKELNVPVMALSQLSRQVEQRGGDKRPMLSDLRDSGAIEQDADMVIFVYRPEMYEATDSEGNPTEGKAEVIIGKHRNGPTGTVQLHFNKNIGQFTQLDPYAHAPGGGGGGSDRPSVEVAPWAGGGQESDAPPF